MNTISHVPDEILGEIFLQIRPYRAIIRQFHAFNTTREHLHYPRPCYQKRYPWVLTHVCRRWRCVAQTIPQLWSYLPAIELSGKYDLHDPSLDHFLRHAKRTPLSLLLWSKNRSSDGVIFSKLVQHVQQWRDVIFFFPDQDFPPFDMIKGQLKALRKATIVRRWPAPIAVDLFADAPVLEELEWLIGLVPFPILPLSLTKYYGFWPGPLAALALLSSAPNLVECKFEAGFDSTDWGEYVIPNLPHTMPHLTTLVLKDCWTSVNENNDKGDVFLGSLVLPQLRYLDLWLSADSGANFRYEDIAGLLGRSRAPLKYLALAFHFQAIPTLNQLKGLLELVPELEFYRHYDCRSANTETEGPLLGVLLNPGLVPKLSTLIWDSFVTQPLPGNSVIDIVRMRSKNRYGVDKGDLVVESYPRSLLYFTLPPSEVRSEVRNELVGWSRTEDPHYLRLVEVSERLRGHFILPVFERMPEVVADINADIDWIVVNHESFHILAVLTSKIHMTLFKLVIRGQSKGRVECNWIPQITEIVSKWQSDSKQHLQKSCWFEHQHLYWVAEGQRDVYNLFWQVAPSHDSWFHTARRSVPVKWTDYIQPENWMPDWEHAELPPKSYEPGAAVVNE